ncbi:four helix bundle protein [Aerosakkonema sp. BLCC-F183]
MAKPDFEKLQVYRIAEKLGNEIWQIVTKWDEFEKNTLGRQIIIAADSIGSNIAKGRAHDYKDNRDFVRIAKDCLDETRHCLRQAYKRSLLTIEDIDKLKEILDELSVQLNAYLLYIENAVKEHPEDPE